MLLVFSPEASFRKCRSEVQRNGESVFNLRSAVCWGSISNPIPKTFLMLEVEYLRTLHPNNALQRWWVVCHRAQIVLGSIAWHFIVDFDVTERDRKRSCVQFQLTFLLVYCPSIDQEGQSSSCMSMCMRIAIFAPPLLFWLCAHDLWLLGCQFKHFSCVWDRMCFTKPFG